jgi:hypothetical protein
MVTVRGPGCRLLGREPASKGHHGYVWMTTGSALRQEYSPFSARHSTVPVNIRAKMVKLSQGAAYPLFERDHQEAGRCGQRRARGPGPAR